MTKQELLDQLISFNWVLLLNGAEVLISTDGDTKTYRQNIFEGALDTGTFRNIYFYVYKEGEAGEVAMYKDSIPKPIISNEDEVFGEEIETYFKAAFPGQQFDIVNPNAELETCFIRTLIDDPSNVGEFVLALYSISRTAPDTYVSTKVNVSDDIISNL